MTIKTIFLIFGIGLACYAVIVSFAGLRFKDFPSRNAMVGLLLLGVFLVGGTASSSRFTSRRNVKRASSRSAKKPASPRSRFPATCGSDPGPEAPLRSVSS